MLDETVVVPKPIFVLFDYSVFAHPMGGLKINVIQTLMNELSPPWYLMFITNGSTFEAEVLRQVREFGLYFYQVFDMSSLIMASPRNMIVLDSIRAVDIAFTPKIANLSVNFRLRQPRDEQQAVDVVCWFARSFEPFTDSNYYSFLSVTDNL